MIFNTYRISFAFEKNRLWSKMGEMIKKPWKINKQHIKYFSSHEKKTSFISHLDKNTLQKSTNQFFTFNTYFKIHRVFGKQVFFCGSC